MNKGAQEENTRKLLEYQLVAQQQTDREDKQLTIMLQSDHLWRVYELLYPQVELTLL